MLWYGISKLPEDFSKGLRKAHHTQWCLLEDIKDFKEIKGKRRKRNVPGKEKSMCKDLRVIVSWSAGHVWERSKASAGTREGSGKKQNKNGRHGLALAKPWKPLKRVLDCFPKSNWEATVVEKSEDQMLIFGKSLWYKGERMEAQESSLETPSTNRRWQWLQLRSRKNGGI